GDQGDRGGLGGRAPGVQEPPEPAPDPPDRQAPDGKAPETRQEPRRETPRRRPGGKEGAETRRAPQPPQGRGPAAPPELGGPAGAYWMRSRRSRMASMPRLLAASISTRSRARPSRIATHDGQVSHGSPSWRFVQLSALARIRARLVLPVPRGPTKRTAWLTR